MKSFPVLRKRAIKNLPFGTTPYSALLVARWDAAQFMNCLINQSDLQKEKKEMKKREWLRGTY